ncbi:MAG: hypothetical protein LC104_16875 [Bacteroidales bacterium]|nr:hypothetical protein [Bacteroidales bacterium]
MFATPALMGAANPLFDPEFLLAVGALVLVLLAGAVAFYFADQWKRKQLTNDYQDMDSLTAYREMLERGELSRTEYERVRDQLAKRIKNPAIATGANAAILPVSQINHNDQGDSNCDSDSPKTVDQEPPRT